MALSEKRKSDVLAIAAKHSVEITWLKAANPQLEALLDDEFLRFLSDELDPELERLSARGVSKVHYDFWFHPFDPPRE